MKEITYNLDFVPGGTVPVVHCAQGDIGRPVRVKFFWGANEYAPTATTASISVLKPDGNAAVITAAISGAEASWKTTEQSTVLSGKLPCVLSIKEGSDIVHSSKFIMDVQRDPCVDATPSESDLGAWQTIANHIIEASAKASAAEAWAVGTIDGVAVSDLSPQYKNNAKYYAEGQKKHADGRIITVTDAAYFPPEKIALYGQSVQSGTPSPSAPAPIADAVNPVLTVAGSNLLDLSQYPKNTTTWANVTLTNNNDGSFNVKGTASASGAFNMGLRAGGVPLKLYKGVKYSMQGINLAYFTEGGSWANVAGTSLGTAQGSEIEPDKDLTIKNIAFYIESGKTYDAKIWPMITAASGASYAPYKAQTVTLSNTLRGIPVASGGNYTDASGQQWLCDTVDKDSGGSWFYTQRVGSLVLDGSTDEAWKYFTQSGTGVIVAYITAPYSIADKNAATHGCLCTSFAERAMNEVWKNDNSFSCLNQSNWLAFRSDTYTKDDTTWRAYLQAHPQQIVYALATPVKYPITGEISQAIEALNMLKPVTTITAGGAVVDVDYLPDAYVFDRLRIMNARIDALEKRVAALEG